MRIFICEDDPERVIWFHDRFRGHDVKFIHTFSRASEYRGPYDLVFLDHDLGGRQLEDHQEDDGALVAEYLADLIGDATVIIHTHNPSGADRIIARLNPDTRWIRCPFGSPAFHSIIAAFELEEANKS